MRLNTFRSRLEVRITIGNKEVSAFHEGNKYGVLAKIIVIVDLSRYPSPKFIILIIFNNLLIELYRYLNERDIKRIKNIKKRV